jgi:ABC-type nitrate/sulfonate/bicarbonate transport system ATPase subunit
VQFRERRNRNRGAANRDEAFQPLGEEAQRDRKVLDGLDLHVEAGEIVALLGRSGCGKSTLLRSIAGLQPLNEGEILIADDASSQTQSSPAFVFQEASLLPWRTAIENVCLPLELKGGFSPTTARARAKQVLRVVEFSQVDEEKFPAELSGGMKMRVSMARALVNEPKLLLLDEPFAALDDMLRWRLNELLLEQQSQTARTMIFVTHNIAEAVFLSRRIAIMHRGHVSEIIENTLPMPRSADLRSTPEFAQMYGLVSQRLGKVSSL